MLWVHISDKRVNTAARLFPHVSFPEGGPDAALMATFGCAPIVEPDYDPETHIAVDSEPYKSDGKWHAKAVRPLNTDELSARAADRLAMLRADRNMRLRESDWTQMPDSPLSPETRAEWAAYRQALRDITIGYSGAPLESVQWPDRPE